MTRNEAISLLEKYNEFLYDNGYGDVIIGDFINTEWAKENLPINNKNERYSINRRI